MLIRNKIKFTENIKGKNTAFLITALIATRLKNA
jgi:hypothetical protein